MLQVSWRWSPKHISRRTTKLRNRNFDLSERSKIFLLLSLLLNLTLSCIWTVYFYFMPLSKKLPPASLPKETDACVWLADSTSWFSKRIASVVIFTFHVTNFALYFQSLPSNSSSLSPSHPDMYQTSKSFSYAYNHRDFSNSKNIYPLTLINSWTISFLIFPLSPDFTEE